MSKIIKLSFLLGFLLSINTVNATQIVCPSSITCNYEEGTCDVSDDWFYSNMATEEDKFPDGQPISLSMIGGYQRTVVDAPGYPLSKEAREKNGYTISCTYEYGKYRSRLFILRYVKNIAGSNWVKSQFGKTHATCSDIKNPEECAGEN
ncbi:MAG: hypothetical protein A3F46_03695 [Legionellales bacterium RIFCSPHIGHO2_12_FULL_42_9]|nr:MAG: hypothetical protein A3F46_03695 [Legionellales bacterium RIFCSPHIGHO2_12_FULL_42_9]